MKLEEKTYQGYYEMRGNNFFVFVVKCIERKLV